MPRIYTSEGDALDFCNKCFPTKEEAEVKYNNTEGYGYSYGEFHPDYKDEDYTCEKCNKKLTGRDN